MGNEVIEMSSKELIELYSEVKDFVNYLDKEQKNVEKMEITNEKN